MGISAVGVYLLVELSAVARLGMSLKACANEHMKRMDVFCQGDAWQYQLFLEYINNTPLGVEILGVRIDNALVVNLASKALVYIPAVIGLLGQVFHADSFFHALQRD